MIVSGPRKPLSSSDRTISLPVWSLAPLYLNRGAPLWGVYGVPEHHSPKGSMELVISTIPRAYWHDVWRLEMTTDDKRGNLARMMDLFACRDVDVIFNEGSIHSFAKRNAMTYILSLNRYSSRHDGNSDARWKNPLPNVPDLEFWILENFADQLVSDESKHLRFKLKRMNLYWHMQASIGSQKYQPIPGKRGVPLKADYSVDPGGRFFETLSKLGEDISYTAAVDTKERCIRILFFPAQGESPAHMQFASYYMDTFAQYRILRIVSDQGGNIIRNQLRHGIPPGKVGVFGRLRADKMGEQNPLRLDLTIEGQHPTMKTPDVTKAIMAAVEADADLRERGVDIVDLKSMSSGQRNK